MTTSSAAITPAPFKLATRHLLGWGLAAVLGAVAGTMTASQGNGGFDASKMQQVLVYAFAAAALGGFDSTLGAVVGGLIVGVLNALTVQYVEFLEGIETYEFQIDTFPATSGRQIPEVLRF